MAKEKSKKEKKSQKAKRQQKAQPIKTPSAGVQKKYPVLVDFLAHDWKKMSARVGFGVYALSLYGNLPDYEEVGSEAITEGGDDKDIDLCLIDREAGHVYIAQCYVANDWEKETAPANKADDLLTGLSWLLNVNVADIPNGIREKAEELQDALQQKEIDSVHLLFIHNCLESGTVHASLAAVASSAKTLLGNGAISVTATEIGLPRLQHLYNSLTKQIVVEEVISIDCAEQIVESGKGWDAVATTISGATLHDLWQKHHDDLFSANIRGFLDMMRRKTSINRGILETVQLEPSRFWAFNNGVTILTKKIEAKPGKIIVTGVSIINGAQTTGVLGNAPRESAAKCKVPCRFIRSSDSQLIEHIITSNNTQNAIKAFDFRSNDPTQRRLQAEFTKYSITYLHRRQGASRLPSGSIQAEVLAPYLSAFHGHFQTAIRQRRAIFEDRSIYGGIFPPEIAAEHVFLVQCFADGLNQHKSDLRTKVTTGNANTPEQESDKLLSFSTSKYYVLAVIGKLAPLILDRPVPNLFTWKTSATWIKPDRSSLTARCKLVVESLIPLIAGQAGPDMYATVRSPDKVSETAKQVGLLLQSLKQQYGSVMSSLRDATDVS